MAYRSHVEVIDFGIVFGASIACVSDKAYARSPHKSHQGGRPPQIKEYVGARLSDWVWGSVGGGVGHIGGMRSFLASASRPHSRSRRCEERTALQEQLVADSFGKVSEGVVPACSLKRARVEAGL